MKALKKMEKKDRLPKPLLECEVPIQLHQERSERLRGIEVSPEEAEARVLDMKDWARHCYVRYRIPMTCVASLCVRKYFQFVAGITMRSGDRTK